MAIGGHNQRSGEPVDVTTSVKDAGTWTKAVGVTVAVKDVDKEYDAVFKEIANMVNLPGFRAGKAPRNVIEKKFGDEIKKQVTANLLDRAIVSALRKESLKLIGEPTLADETVRAARGEAFSFELNVEVRPEFQLGQYTGIQVEQEETELLPNEVDDALTRVRERFAEVADAPAEHAIKDWDSIEGTLRVLIDGNEVHKEDTHMLVAQGHVMGAYAHLGAEFLAGAKKGEKRTAEANLDKTFPVEAHREKKATLEFEIKGIRTRALPEVNDELAKKLGLTSIDELKDKIRSELVENLRETTKEGTRGKIVGEILKNTPFELPRRVLENAAKRNITQRLNYLERMGATEEMVKDQIEAIHKFSAEQATDELKRYFVLQAVAEKEGIKIDDDDVDAELVRRARSQGMKASELYDKMVQEGTIDTVQLDLLLERTLELLTDSADVKVVPRKAPAKDDGHGHGHSHEHGGHDHSHSHDHSEAPGEHGHEHCEHGHEHGEACHGHEHGEAAAPEKKAE